MFSLRPFRQGSVQIVRAFRTPVGTGHAALAAVRVRTMSTIAPTYTTESYQSHPLLASRFEASPFGRTLAIQRTKALQCAMDRVEFVLKKLIMHTNYYSSLGRGQGKWETNECYKVLEHLEGTSYPHAPCELPEMTRVAITNAFAQEVHERYLNHVKGIWKEDIVLTYQVNYSSIQFKWQMPTKHHAT